jgi:fumarate hydratase class I
LLRPLDDENPDPRLAELEDYIVERANTLGIGTMGFGGSVSLIGCKITARNRLPASFFVSVAYDCWAYRRLGVILDAASGDLKQWLYREAKTDEATDAGRPLALPSLDGAVRLSAPVSEEQVRQLKVGDVVLISGGMYTGRDAVHAHLMHHDAPVDLNGSVLYHCGPVALKNDAGQWKIAAAGPTTSIREEPYQGDILRKFGVRVVIGKGGMGANTSAALQEHGGVYLNAIGGAAQYYARSIKRVKNVHLLEFGIPEAMWELEVEDFPAIVTMDAHGNSLHREVAANSGEALKQLAGDTLG